MINKNTKIYFLALAFAFVGAVSFASHPALAQVHDQNLQSTIDNPFKCPSGDCSLISFFNAIVDDILIPIGAVIAVMAFIWAGFLFVTAQGDEAKIKKARSALLYVAIGAAVLLGARTIGTVIQGTIDQVKTAQT